MCHDKSLKNHLIKAVDGLLKDNSERWALIENKSGRLEIVPEKSLIDLNEKIIYKLKT